MKKMIAAAAILAVSSVNAEELKFGDVNYFLKQGQMNLAADISSTQNEIKGEDTRGVLIASTFTYALSNELNASVGLAYAYDRETEEKGTQDVGSSGLANPLLAVNYRLLNQNTSGYNLDFGVIARINVQDAEIGDSNATKHRDGNYASGRSSLELNARTGKKWNEANEWQLVAGINYFKDGDSTLRDVSGDIDLDEESSLDYFARATYQYRPVNEFMMLLSAEATQVDEQTVKATGVKVKADGHLDFTFKFTAKYLITENFIAKFNYAQTRNPDYDLKTNGTKSEVTKRHDKLFGLGVDFLF